MHILVINFNLKGIGDEDYRGLVEPIAPAFAGLPGLVSKTWLANAETNTYGGVYVSSDRGAMEAYKETDIYKGTQANPHFENLTVTDFAVVENATRHPGSDRGRRLRRQIHHAAGGEISPPRLLREQGIR